MLVKLDMMSYQFPPPQRRGFHIILLSVLAGLLLTLPGCGFYNSFFDSDKDTGADESQPENPFSAEVLLREGMDLFNHGQYRSCLEKFQALRDRYPFSDSSMVAELKSADAHYYLKEYMEALQLYNEFETSHPTNEAIPYVLFQKGMCYFKRIDTIDRDPGAAQEAILAFNRLLRSYPHSPYSDEAREQIRAAREFLAKHEMYVADFYMNVEAYPQAIGRLQYLLDNYPDSSVAPEAKKLLALLEAGTPPKGKWTDWIPQISMPDWAIFRQMGFGFGAKTE